MAQVVDILKLAWNTANEHQKKGEGRLELIVRSYDDVHSGDQALGVSLGNMARGGLEWADRAERLFKQLGRMTLKGGWKALQGRGANLAAAAIRGAGSAGQEAYQTNRRWLEDSARITAERDLALRRVLQQGAIGADQKGSIDAAIKSAALRYGVSYAVVADVAKNLVQHGFKKDAFQPGGSLDEMLSFLATMGQLRGPGDSRQYEVAAAGKMLGAWGQEKNALNLRELAKMAFGLRRRTHFTLHDLLLGAEEGAAMRLAGHVSPREHLALMALMLRVQKGERVPIQLRRFLMTLVSAKTNPRHKRALRGLGLAPEDVDFVGEDFPEVLLKLIDAKAGVLPPGPVSQAVNAGVAGLESAQLALEKMLPPRANPFTGEARADDRSLALKLLDSTAAGGLIGAAHHRLHRFREDLWNRGPLTESDYDQRLSLLFGTKTIAGARVLIGDFKEHYEEMLGLTQDRGGYRQAEEIARTGLNALTDRSEEAVEQAYYDEQSPYTVALGDALYAEALKDTPPIVAQRFRENFFSLAADPLFTYEVEDSLRRAAAGRGGASTFISRLTSGDFLGDTAAETLYGKKLEAAAQRALSSVGKKVTLPAAPAGHGDFNRLIGKYPRAYAALGREAAGTTGRAIEGRLVRLARGQLPAAEFSGLENTLASLESLIDRRLPRRFLDAEGDWRRSMPSPGWFLTPAIEHAAAVGRGEKPPEEADGTPAAIRAALARDELRRGRLGDALEDLGKLPPGEEFEAWNMKALDPIDRLLRGLPDDIQRLGDSELRGLEREMSIYKTRSDERGPSFGEGPLEAPPPRGEVIRRYEDLKRRLRNRIQQEFDFSQNDRPPGRHHTDVFGLLTRLAGVLAKLPERSLLIGAKGQVAIAATRVLEPFFAAVEPTAITESSAESDFATSTASPGHKMAPKAGTKTWRMGTAHPFASPRIGGRKFWTSRTMRALEDELRKRLAERADSGADVSLEQMWHEAADVVDPDIWKEWGPGTGAADFRRPGQIMWRTAMGAATADLMRTIDLGDDENTIRSETVSRLGALLPEADAETSAMIREGFHANRRGEAFDPVGNELTKNRGQTAVPAKAAPGTSLVDRPPPLGLLRFGDPPEKIGPPTEFERAEPIAIDPKPFTSAYPRNAWLASPASQNEDAWGLKDAGQEYYSPFMKAIAGELAKGKSLQAATDASRETLRRGPHGTTVQTSEGRFGGFNPGEKRPRIGLFITGDDEEGAAWLDAASKRVVKDMKSAFPDMETIELARPGRKELEGAMAKMRAFQKSHPGAEAMVYFNAHGEADEVDPLIAAGEGSKEGRLLLHGIDNLDEEDIGNKELKEEVGWEKGLWLHEDELAAMTRKHLGGFENLAMLIDACSGGAFTKAARRPEDAWPENVLVGTATGQGELSNLLGDWEGSLRGFMDKSKSLGQATIDASGKTTDVGAQADPEDPTTATSRVGSKDPVGWQKGVAAPRIALLIKGSGEDPNDTKDINNQIARVQRSIKKNYPGTEIHTITAPTKARLRAAFKTLEKFSKDHEGAEAAIWMGGHGWSEPAKEGSTAFRQREGSNEGSFWLRQDKGVQSYLKERELKQLTREHLSRFKELILLIDACGSGAFVD